MTVCGPMSGLSRALIDDFGDDVVAMVRWAATAKSADYGRFAPRVFEAARQGESGAQDIVGAAARAIETLTLRVFELGAPRVAYIGGIAEPLRDFSPRRNFSSALVAARHDAIDGAILIVGGAVAGEGGVS